MFFRSSTTSAAVFKLKKIKTTIDRLFLSPTTSLRRVQVRNGFSLHQTFSGQLTANAIPRLTPPQPNLLWLKKAQAIWRGVLTAEVLKFPHRRSHVIKSLLKTAKRLEDSSPETCIAIQGQVIEMMAEESLSLEEPPMRL